MLNINLHHINYCFNIALPLLTQTNLVYININVGILLFLNVAPSQNLVIAPDASIGINKVCDFQLNRRIILLVVLKIYNFG